MITILATSLNWGGGELTPRKEIDTFKTLLCRYEVLKLAPIYQYVIFLKLGNFISIDFLFKIILSIYGHRFIFIFSFFNGYVFVDFQYQTNDMICTKVKHKFYMLKSIYVITH
jgi:hypothetical protein